MTEQFPPFGEDLFNEDGTPVVTWDLVLKQRTEHLEDGSTTSRPLEPEEEARIPAVLALKDLLTTERDLLLKIKTAVTNNRTWLNRTSAPTNLQVVEHIDRLTRQMNAVMMLMGKDYRDAAGT